MPAGTQVRSTFAQVNFIGPNNGVLVLQPKYSNAEKRLRDTWMNEEVRAKLRPAFQTVYGPDIRVQLQQAAAGATPASASTQSPAASNSQPQPSEQSPNQLADQDQSFNVPEDIEAHPAVQQIRNVGGRVISVEDG